MRHPRASCTHDTSSREQRQDHALIQRHTEAVRPAPLYIRAAHTRPPSHTTTPSVGHSSPSLTRTVHAPSPLPLLCLLLSLLLSLSCSLLLVSSASAASVSDSPSRASSDASWVALVTAPGLANTTLTSSSPASHGVFSSLPSRSAGGVARIYFTLPPGATIDGDGGLEREVTIPTLGRTSPRLTFSVTAADGVTTSPSYSISFSTRLLASRGWVASIAVPGMETLSAQTKGGSIDVPWTSAGREVFLAFTIPEGRSIEPPELDPVVTLPSQRGESAVYKFKYDGKGPFITFTFNVPFSPSVDFQATLLPGAGMGQLPVPVDINPGGVGLTRLPASFVDSAVSFTFTPAAGAVLSPPELAPSVQLGARGSTSWYNLTLRSEDGSNEAQVALGVQVELGSSTGWSAVVQVEGGEGYTSPTFSSPPPRGAGEATSLSTVLIPPAFAGLSATLRWSFEEGARLADSSSGSSGSGSDVWRFLVPSSDSQNRTYQFEVVSEDGSAAQAYTVVVRLGVPDPTDDNDGAEELSYAPALVSFALGWGSSAVPAQFDRQFLDLVSGALKFPSPGSPPGQSVSVTHRFVQARSASAAAASVSAATATKALRRRLFAASTDPEGEVTEVSVALTPSSSRDGTAAALSAALARQLRCADAHPLPADRRRCAREEAAADGVESILEGAGAVYAQMLRPNSVTLQDGRSVGSGSNVRDGGEGGGGGLSAGAVVGIVFGALLGCALLLICLHYALRHHRESVEQAEEEAEVARRRKARLEAGGRSPGHRLYGEASVYGSVGNQPLVDGAAPPAVAIVPHQHGNMHAQQGVR